MTATNLVFKNTYRDSIVLMRLSRDLEALDEDGLISAMAAHPTLLQRPIMDNGTTAVLGRPFERVLEVV